MEQRMRGVNFGGWFSQVDAIEEKDPQGFPGLTGHIDSFLGAADFTTVAAWGFDHVRLPVDYFNVFTESDLKPREDILSRLDRAVQWAEDAGLKLVLDLHKCPGHDFHRGASEEQPFFSDPAYRRDAKRVWTILAERYGSYSHLMLEILNEPVATDSAVWDSVKNEMWAHIRAHAPKATIVIGSNRWNSAPEFAALTPVDDDNVLYSFHCYIPLPFTHQHAPWITSPYIHQSRSWPGEWAPPEDTVGRLPHESGRWDKARLQQAIQPALDFRARYGLPVACNEFGVYVAAGRQDQLAWMRDFMDILKDTDVGFSYWNYKNLDFGLYSIGESSHAGLPQYQGDDHLDHELLAILQGKQ